MDTARRLPADWISFDPARERLLRMITTVIAFPVILVLLLAFPSFWRDMGRSMGPHMVGVFIGFTFAVVAFMATLGMGIVHLVGYLALSFRRPDKPGAASKTNGVWDRELDQS